MDFNYNVPAGLFMPKRQGGTRQPLTYRRFRTAAEAIRFAVEELPASHQLRAFMDIGGQTYRQDTIRKLYDGKTFPLKRRARAAEPEAKSA